jgi:O-methyltransferase
MPKLRTLARGLSRPRGAEAFALARTAFRTLFRNRYPFYWPDLDWLADGPFWTLLDHYGERDGLNAHRRKLLFELAAETAHWVNGDTAECGAFRGLGSHLICTAMRGQARGHRRHFVFDSFEGLSKPVREDGRYWSQGDLACDEAIVAKNLGEFEFVTLLKGWIPERFPDVADRRFCFVHIDVDLACPTEDSLVFFFPRLNAGGVILADDYGFASCPGVTAIVDDFVNRTPAASLIRLPAGGAIIRNRGIEAHDQAAPVSEHA